MAEGTLTRELVDQLTESGVEWDKLDEVFDTVLLGLGEADESKRRSFPISSGRSKLMESLLQRFPREEPAIRKFFRILKSLRGATTYVAMLKLLPKTLAEVLVSSGLLLWMVPAFRYYQRSLSDVLNELTDNADLKAVLAYSYGDYGEPRHVHVHVHVCTCKMYHVHYVDNTVESP